MQNVHDKLQKSKPEIKTLLVSLNEAGHMLGVSARTVRRLIQDKQLPQLVKVGHSSRISYQAVLDYVASLTRKLGGMAL